MPQCAQHSFASRSAHTSRRRCSVRLRRERKEPHTWYRHTDKTRRYTCACLGNLCWCVLTGSAADAACCFAPPLSAVGAADRRRRRRRQRKEGRERERERASCRGRSPEWLRGGSLVTGNAKACDESCALSGVCCRRFTRASQVSPQQKGASDTSSYPTRARCTT